MTRLELTILMPCLNEARTVGTCVEKAMAFLQSRGIDGEVLVADNGSTDGSQDLALRHGARVVEVPLSGYGAALLGGIQAARGRFVVMGDSDDSYDFSDLDLFVQRLREGHDLVMGNRFAGGISAGAMPPLHRYLGNPVLSLIGRRLFRVPIGDFHCGLRAFHRDRILRLGLQSPGMEFASEMVVRAQLFDYRICEVPTTLSQDGRDRRPHLRPFRDGWRHLRFLFLFSPRWLFFYPGLLLVVVGVTLGSVLAFTQVTVGSITLGVNTLVVCGAMVLVGYQAVWYAVLSKAFASREGLLPLDRRVERFRQWFPLEKALLVAGLLLFAGMAGLVVAVLEWDFGPLDPENSLRLVVPSVILLVTGAQTALSSLLLSVLTLPSARPAAWVDLTNTEAVHISMSPEGTLEHGIGHDAPR